MNTRELIARKLLVKRITEDQEKLIVALEYVWNKTKVDIPHNEAKEILKELKNGGK